MPTDGQVAAINGDHDPAEFEFCPRCRNSTFRGTIPTSGGIVIIYVCDACDATGPRIFIPHLERFERPDPAESTGDTPLDGLLRLAKGSAPNR
jgi:hypothetical protein